MPKNTSFLIGLILTILLTNLLFAMTSPQAHLDRIKAINECFQDRQIPCRWVIDLENSYGSPIFNYHPPLPYYFGEIIFLLTKNLSTSAVIMSSVGLIGSYLFMYLFIAKFFSKLKASFLAFFYTLLSFLIYVIFSGRIQLIWGLMLLPLILLSLNFFLQKRKFKNFLFFSVSLSLLILSADFALILIGLISLWIIYQYFRTQSFNPLITGISAILFAFLLSSFYTLPAILEGNLVYSTSFNNPLGFLPKSAAERQKSLINTPYQILVGDSDISNFQQGTNWLKFEANTREHTIIRLSQFYFPNWKIYVDGKEVAVEYKNNSLGLMTIILGQGNHQIEAKLYDTPIRSFANLLSLAGIIIFAILILISSGKVRKWATYYRKRMN